MGVFTERLRRSAQALGHVAEITILLPSEAELHGSGLVLFGRYQLQWSVSQPNQAEIAVLQTRHTLRKKYYEGISKDLAKAVVDAARSSGMKLTQLSSVQAEQAVWLNQRAVFDDVFDKPV